MSAMAKKYRQLAFHVDQRKCTGCKACQIACKDKHDLPVGVSWRRVPEYTGGTWHTDPQTGTFTPQVFSYYTSISCNHCDKPICVEVCPSTAMRKGDNGVVTVDPSVCIGCRYCEMACPYHAPQFNPDSGVMTKCDFCADRIAEGKAPACVAACPSRVLDYGEADDLRRKYGANADITPLPKPDITRPNLVITPHPAARPSGQGTGSLAHPSEA